MRLLLMIPSFITWVVIFSGAIKAGLTQKSFIVGTSAFIIFILCILFEIRSYKKQQQVIKDMSNNLNNLSKSFDKLLEATTGAKN